MGINVHGFNLLRYAAQKKRLGRVATIGRQAIHIPKEKVRKLLNLAQETDFGPYCEDLLKAHFGATVVDSFDNSDYEQATHIVDLNGPLVIGKAYDTVMDFGSIEHIFNVPQALKNISAACNDGGQILHMLPANNFCGHGFWQFSPELFFSLYSEVNGYHETEVFLADVANEYGWYEVKRPHNGQRAETNSRTGLFVLVRTTRTSSFSHESVQQSDYIHLWNNPESDIGTLSRDAFQRYLGSGSLERRIKQAVGRSPFESVARLAFKQLKKFAWSETRLSNRNPHLTRRSVADLMMRGTTPEWKRTDLPVKSNRREQS